MGMAEKENNLMAPLATLHWVDRNKLKANDYNPNRVSKENLSLLNQSILANGWTLPIVCLPDYTIIDGYHRWLVSGWESLSKKLGNRVPVVFVRHKDKAGAVYGTVTHNRARGTHLLGPMKSIIKQLLSQGRSVREISKELGMRPEEIFRLSDLTKEQFLKLMASLSDTYSKEVYMRHM
jgi:ParB-like chromosome segregation protein Spo0J